MKLRVGAGREIITPKIGGSLFGYYPGLLSKAVNDDLTVTALAFVSDNTKSLLISATVCLIDNDLSDRLRDLISKAADIPQDNVIICATHTHSAPPLVVMTGWGGIDEKYCDDIFIPGCIKAAKTAFNSLESAYMGVGKAKSRVGVNRRELLQSGEVTLGQNPWGIYDSTMTVISFRSESDKPIANLVHYGAHCTAAGINHEITRDWPGVMIDRLEKETGVITAFINGAEGDTGPRLSSGKTIGDISHVVEIGSLAAVDATEIYRNTRNYSIIDCSVISGIIEIPYNELPSLRKAKSELKKFKKIPENNIDLAKYTSLQEIINKRENNITGEKNLSIRQTILRIGNVLIIPMPYEVFSEISLRLRASVPDMHVLLTSCSNGSRGYLPSQDQICRGGYEVEVFHWLYPHCLPDNADDLFINEILDIMKNNLF